MVKNNMSFIVLIVLTLIVIHGCTRRNNDKFIFFQGDTPIVFTDYDIYSNELDNVYLVLKNYNRRNYIVNNRIDSVHFMVNGKVYRADLVKINGKRSKFSVTVQNNGSRLFVDGYNQYKQEMLYIGQESDLNFITECNEIYMVEDELSIDELE